MALQINVARTAGFCFGVVRAVEMAEKNNTEGNQVYMLGNIVHNEHVVQRLADQGIKVVDKLEDIEPGGTLMIRAHGATPETYQKARERGLEIVDASCPLVLEVQMFARELEAEGYRVIVIGDHDHQEVKGISAQVEDPIVIAKPEEVEEKVKRMIRKAGVVVQSTQNVVNVQEIVAKLVPKVYTLKVINTICAPTKSHQKEIWQMPKENDVMIIVGSFISANTKRLTSISKSLNEDTYQVETAKDLKKEWFKSAKSVGVSAGASTPDWLIQEVVDGLQALEVGVAQEPVLNIPRALNRMT